MADGEIANLLADVRAEPAKYNKPSDTVLGAIFGHVVKTGPPEPSEIHWFCSKASETLREAATFLIRLFAYNSPLVETWKAQYSLCVNECVQCALGVEIAKTRARSVYMSSFPPDTLVNFFKLLEDWELSNVISELCQRNILSGQNVVASPTLYGVPVGLTYRMVANMVVFRDPRIRAVLEKCYASIPLDNWPTDPLPAGMLALLVDENDALREWAEERYSALKQKPIPPDNLTFAHTSVAETIFKALANDSASSSQGASAAPIRSDIEVYWSGILKIVALMDPELLLHHQRLRVDIRRTVLGHLSDNGPHLHLVLNTFILLLGRLKEKIWQGEGPEYPQVIFDSIKDNPAYVEGMSKALSTSREAAGPYIKWYQPFLVTVEQTPVYGEVIAKMAGLLCEELQHPRFQDAAPATIAIAAQILEKLVRRHPQTHAAAVASAIDIHVAKLSQVALAASFDNDKWALARKTSRSLLFSVMKVDARTVLAAFDGVYHALAEVSRKTPVKTIIVKHTSREMLWKTICQAVDSRDQDAFAELLNIAYEIAHVDIPTKKAYQDVFNATRPTESASPKMALEDVSKSLQIMHDSISGALGRYVEDNSATSALALLRRESITQHVVSMMMSPVEALHTGAKDLVGVAFDVDVRSECFRALFKELPDPAFSGALRHLEMFMSFVNKPPEACSLAKMLVRCFTDIIEVLCESPGGLLRSASYAPASSHSLRRDIPKLWEGMAGSLKYIFRRTPTWARWFENEAMTEWMRDALIFGRDMIAQRETFEGAAAADKDAKAADRKFKAKVGQKMLQDMQPVLLDLTKWLRLTDEELLHQTFSFLQSLLSMFESADVRPEEETRQKLDHFVRDALNARDPAKRAGMSERELRNGETRLNNVRLKQLQDSLAAFDEEEVEIVEPPKRPSPAPAQAKPAKKEQQSRLTGFISRDSKPSTSAPPKPSKPLARPAPSTVQPPAKKAKVSHRFSEEEQKKIDEDVPMPKMRRAGAVEPQTKSALKNLKFRRKDEGRAASTSSAPITEEDDSDEDDDGLKDLVKAERKRQPTKKPEPRGIKLLDVPQIDGHIERKLRRGEEDRRRAMRAGPPDFSRLHAELLSWDYDHMGDEPPGFDGRLQPVPDRFDNFQHYDRVFSPLLLFECWAQLQQSKNDVMVTENLPCTISSRAYTDRWIDLEVTITRAEDMREFYLAETDIVLLRKVDTRQPLLAKVQSSVTPASNMIATLRCSGAAGVKPENGTAWEMSKVMSLSTIHREYTALVQVPYYDLPGNILRPNLDNSPSISGAEVQRMQERYSVNEPQAVAITKSIHTKGFSLIQGPPGTGKTSTICGLVSAYLYEANRRITRPMENDPNQPRILLCAPSNAAIDEVAFRLKCSPAAIAGKLNVVRIGAEKAIGDAVKDITLDSLADKKLNVSTTNTENVEGELSSLFRELNAAKHEINAKQKELAQIVDNSARAQTLSDELRMLKSRRHQVSKQVDQMKEVQKNNRRTMDASRRKARRDVLEEAHVVCSTLSGAGHESLNESEFQMIIIDEAAQAIELSSLIPFKFSCSHCVLVGDEKQLPPTVISMQATKFRYNQSLFVRLQRQSPNAVNLLSIQYRMHPSISALPSKVFYDSRLKDGPDMEAKTKQPWQFDPKFGAYRFFNVFRGVEDRAGAKSSKNIAECEVAIALYSRLVTQFSSSGDFAAKVGIIAGYKGQIVELRRRFENRFGRDITKKIAFNTVDGFQGQEKDVIIFSCVRAGTQTTNIGFMSDTRRMNVALTRAKSSLFILGHADTLSRSDETWKQIVADAKERKLMTDVDVSYFTAPITQTSVPKTPTKKAAPRSRVTSQNAASAPPPANLMTPTALKKSSSKKDLSEAAAKPASRKDKTNDQPVASSSYSVAPQPAPNPAPPAPPRAGEKRRDNGAPPHKPPAKKKKGGPSLFMPKNSNKGIQVQRKNG
ncbi:SEN1 N terminal-domain-containing protein [Schizophyllum commune]